MIDPHSLAVPTLAQQAELARMQQNAQGPMFPAWYYANAVPFPPREHYTPADTTHMTGPKVVPNGKA